MDIIVATFRSRWWDMKRGETGTGHPVCCCLMWRLLSPIPAPVSRHNRSTKIMLTHIKRNKALQTPAEYLGTIFIAPHSLKGHIWLDPQSGTKERCVAGQKCLFFVFFCRCYIVHDLFPWGCHYCVVLNLLLHILSSTAEVTFISTWSVTLTHQ